MKPAISDEVGHKILTRLMGMVEPGHLGAYASEMCLGASGWRRRHASSSCA
jgi:hypothetical protein